MNKKLLALYGLKWNPFAPELPVEALHVSPTVDHFCWRIENSLVREGGFALITGNPGTGKSVTLRLLAERLRALRDLNVGRHDPSQQQSRRLLPGNGRPVQCRPQAPQPLGWLQGPARALA